MSQTVENHIRDSKEILKLVKGKSKILFICKPKKVNRIYITKCFQLDQNRWKISNYLN